MSRIVDEHGYILCPYVRADYDRIIERNRMRFDGGRSAEAYLRLILRLEADGRWDYATASLRRPQ